MDSENSQCEDFEYPQLSSGISIDLIDGEKYKIEFNFDKSNLRSIIKEVVAKDKLNSSCICGGYFTKLKRAITTPDIYIFDDSKYLPEEEYLNSFLNEQFREFRFDQLGTTAPLGIFAKKKVIMNDKKEANVYFTYIPFPKTCQAKSELLNTYDLEPCRIMYSYSDNLFYCSVWFTSGGNMIAENRKPSKEFLDKYYDKGFCFQDNVFNCSKGWSRDINRM
ncbi:unnamed protein product [Brachionus calyciflorus]|uniref:Uncharacterized protein n=1 Tax=Brachionus calyciflorus TaxID=104777 RepID=A0A813TDS3_9BILA|nr:unnamed protein product [Brachionus calyciflorus]